MITREFSFFSFMLSTALIGSTVPILSSLSLIVIPLIYIVSGKKFVLYYIALQTIVNLPYEVQAIIRLQYMLPTMISMINFAHKMSSMSGDLNAQQQMINNSTIRPSQIKSLTPYMIQSGGIPIWMFGVDIIIIIGCGCLLFYMSKQTYKKYRLLYNILKSVSKIAKNYHT